MNTDLSFGGTKFPRALEVRQQLYAAGLAGQSTRFRTLDRLDAFYKSLEYAHQDKDWNGYSADRLEAISPDVILPLGFNQPAADELLVHQKRPTAPLRLSPMVVDRFTGLLFSKDRTPRIKVDDDPISDDFVKAVFKKARFWRSMYQCRTYGGSQGSSLMSVHLRPDKIKGKGRFAYKAHSPKTIADVVWEDPDLKVPAGILIQFIFVKELEVLDEKTGRPSGKTQQVPYLYRRIIDEEMDVVFIPDMIRGMELPDLRVDERLSYRHDLGRFPGAWIQNLPQDDEMDGIPDCDGAFQMFETIDRQVAQQNHSLLANMDPTLVIGRDQKLEKMNVPLRKGSANALNVGVGGFANYLEIAGAGIMASAAFVKDLRQAAMDKAQCVLVDPEQISGAAQSAKAIEYIYGPMLERAGRLREQYGQAIEDIVSITLDLARTWADPLKYEGRAVPTFDLPPRMEEEDADPDNPDVDPIRTYFERAPGAGDMISLKWGPFFPPTPGDIEAGVTTIGAAVAAGILDIDTAVELVAPLFGIEDVENLKRKVREDGQEKKAAAESLGLGSAAMGALYPQPHAEKTGGTPKPAPPGGSHPGVPSPAKPPEAPKPPKPGHVGGMP